MPRILFFAAFTLIHCAVLAPAMAAETPAAAAASAKVEKVKRIKIGEQWFLESI